MNKSDRAKKTLERLMLDQWFVKEVLLYEKPLLRFIYRFCRDVHESRDIKQDVYVKVYEKAVVTRPECIKSYLFETARNLLSDRHRRSQIVSIQYSSGMMPEMTNLISPDRVLNGRQEMKLFIDALNSLPSQCRKVMYLRRVENLSQTEVAKRLNMKEGTIESHVSRGTKILVDKIWGDNPTE